MHGVASRNGFPGQFASHLYIRLGFISASPPQTQVLNDHRKDTFLREKRLAYLLGRQSPGDPSHTAARSALSPDEKKLEIVINVSFVIMCVGMKSSLPLSLFRDGLSLSLSFYLREGTFNWIELF